MIWKNFGYSKYNKYSVIKISKNNTLLSYFVDTK